VIYQNSFKFTWVLKVLGLSDVFIFLWGSEIVKAVNQIVQLSKKTYIEIPGTVQELGYGSHRDAILYL
jgi:hypothetical protein